MSPREVKTWGGIPTDELRERWGRASVHAYGTVDSTNDALRDLADDGAPEGTIVVARTQKAGRGRGGRAWASPEGAGLYLSLLFRPASEVVPSLVTIVAGVDVALALRSAYPGTVVEVKWPNDLVAGGRKLGGILAETSRREGEGRRLIVGVGVNVVADRLPDALEGAIAFDELVEEVDLAGVADAVVAGLERRLRRPPESLDEASLDEVDRLDWLKNRRVEHRLPDAEPMVGTATGIAPDGALLLRPDRGALRRITVGSVEAVS